MRKVLVVEHEPSEGPGLLGLALERAGVVPLVVRTFDGEAVPRSLGAASGLVVLGGSMAVYEAHAHLRDEVALLQTAVAAGAPVLGICLGSQLLAAALGSTVAKAPATEIGWYRVRLSEAAREDTLFAGLPADLVAFHWHGDAFALPPGAVQLARSTLTPCQAFRFGARAWGIQFHPEVTQAVLTAMVRGGGDELSAAGVDGEQILAAGPRELLRAAEHFGPLFDRWAQLV